MFDLLVDHRIEKIQKLIDELDWSQARVARYVKMSAPHLSNLLAGNIKQPHENTLDRLIEKLAQAVAKRDGGDSGDPDDRIPSNFKIRIISEVAAGDFDTQFDVNLMSEEGVPGALYPHPMQDPKLLVVSGSSMTCDTAESIEEGDLVLFGNALVEEIPDGEIVVARHRRRKTHQVKIMNRLKGGMIRLSPANPKFKPVDVVAEELDLRRVLIVIRRRYLRNVKGGGSGGGGGGR